MTSNNTSNNPNDDLTDALKNKNLQLAFQSIKAGADNLNDELLTYCSMENSEQIVAFLVNNGANNYKEAMHKAAENKNLSYSFIFYEHGFNDFDDAIKEFLYVTNSSVQAVQLIFADSTLQDKREYLFASSARLGDMESVDYYKSLGCCNYNLAYAYAAETDQLEICKLLVSWGANDHNWALQVAARAGSHNVVEYAYSRGAYNHDVALTLSCKNGFLTKVKLFLERGATKFLVALEAAIKQGNSSLVKHILKYVNSPQFKDELKKIIEVAEKQGIPFVVKLLEEHLSSLEKTVENLAINELENLLQ